MEYTIKIEVQINEAVRPMFYTVEADSYSQACEKVSQIINQHRPVPVLILSMEEV